MYWQVRAGQCKEWNFLCPLDSPCCSTTFPFIILYFSCIDSLIYPKTISEPFYFIMGLFDLNAIPEVWGVLSGSHADNVKSSQTHNLPHSLCTKPVLKGACEHNDNKNSLPTFCNHQSNLQDWSLVPFYCNLRL